jgi:hypothetical protein
VEGEEDTAAKVEAIRARRDLMEVKENHRRDQAPHTPTQGVVPPLDPAPPASLTDTTTVGLLFLIGQGSCRHWAWLLS